MRTFAEFSEEAERVLKLVLLIGILGTLLGIRNSVRRIADNMPLNNPVPGTLHHYDGQEWRWSGSDWDLIRPR